MECITGTKLELWYREEVGETSKSNVFEFDKIEVPTRTQGAYVPVVGLSLLRARIQPCVWGDVL